ncbi:MAG TPA: hypothetical protein VHR65_06275, partial [Solirubrobacterales bacterium]|nr:hypothetical protein [Solirubrobacterales bacterium]
ITLLIAAQPWAPATVAPQLSLAPGIGVGLGDAVKLPSAPQLAPAPAQEVVRGGTRLVANEAAAEQGAGRPQFGVAAARVVVRVPPVSPTPEQAAPKPPPPPAEVPPPLPVSSSPSEPPPQPPATTGSTGETQGPIASGGVPGGGATNVIQVCEGDDYTLSLSPAEGSEGEALPMAPVRHDLTVYFAAGNEAVGAYLVFLDGLPVEMGEAIAPSEPGHSCAQIDLTPFVGESIEAATEVHVEGVVLGEDLEPALP